MAFGLSKITSLFSRGNDPAKTGVLGIDIGASAIKIVQLKSERGVPTLETYGELQLGPYDGVDLGRGTHLAPSKSIEALVDILRESGATATNAAFAFAYNASFVSVISIPTADQEKIGSMVAIEAKKYIPISLTKVSLDWFPLAVHESGSTEVLVSAIYNEVLDRYKSIMQGSGLSSVASEIEIFSTIRSVLSPEDDVVAILDCGAASTRMYIVRKGVVNKTHSVPLSGVELTEAVAKSAGVEFKEAEELKRQFGLLGDPARPEMQKVLTTGLVRGLREINTVIKRYEEAEGVVVGKVILSGSGALLQGLRSYVEDMYAKPTHLADPFAKVAYPAFLEDTLKIAGPSFAVAVGVALRAHMSE